MNNPAWLELNALRGTSAPINLLLTHVDGAPVVAAAGPVDGVCGATDATPERSDVSSGKIGKSAFDLVVRPICGSES